MERKIEKVQRRKKGEIWGNAETLRATEYGYVGVTEDCVRFGFGPVGSRRMFRQKKVSKIARKQICQPGRWTKLSVEAFETICESAVTTTAARKLSREVVDLAPADQYRVRVRIADPSRYSGDAAERLNGAVGTVVRFNPESSCGFPMTGPAVLVRFDVAIPPGWPGTEDVTAFWFPECDLELDVEIGTRWQLHGTRGPVYELREVNPREFDHTYPYALALVAYDEKNERRKLGEMICVEREWFDASHVRRI